MDYTAQDYQADLKNPELLHLKTRERFQGFYDQCALGPAKDIKYVPARMNWIAFKPDARIIELGCCSGANVIHWLNKYPNVSITAVDISQGFIDETRRRVDEAGFTGRVLYHTGFIEDLPAGTVTGTYDDVVLTETLEHVQDPVPVLSVAWALLKPGGNLWITVPSTRIGTFSHVRGISVAEMGELLQEVGTDDPTVLQQVNDPSTIKATRCHVVKSKS